MIDYEGPIAPSWLTIGAFMKAYYRGAIAPGEVIRVGRGEMNRPSWLLVLWAMLWCRIWKLA